MVCKGEIFQFLPLLVIILDLSGNQNIENIIETVRDSDFERIFDPQVVQECTFQRGKKLNFHHFCRPYWSLTEN